MSSPRRPDWLRVHPAFYSVRTEVLGRVIKRPGRDISRSPPSNTGVKDELSQAVPVLRPYVFVAMAVSTLPS